MGRTVQDRTPVTIASGQSLSSEVNLSSQTVVGIAMPADWTAADISFAGAAASGGMFYAVYDAEGTELVVDASDDRFIVIAPDALRGVRFLKVRSGTVGSAVTQGADRTLHLVVENL